MNNNYLNYKDPYLDYSSWYFFNIAKISVQQSLSFESGTPFIK